MTIVKTEGVQHSARLNRCSPDAQAMYAHFISTCPDNFGRCHYNVYALVTAKLFPRRDDDDTVKKLVAQWRVILAEYAREGLIKTWEEDGCVFLEVADYVTSGYWHRTPEPPWTVHEHTLFCIPTAIHKAKIYGLKERAKALSIQFRELREKAAERKAIAAGSGTRAEAERSHSAVPSIRTIRSIRSRTDIPSPTAAVVADPGFPQVSENEQQTAALSTPTAPDDNGHDPGPPITTAVADSPAGRIALAYHGAFGRPLDKRDRLALDKALHLPTRTVVDGEDRPWTEQEIVDAIRGAKLHPDDLRDSGGRVHTTLADILRYPDRTGPLMQAGRDSRLDAAAAKKPGNGGVRPPARVTPSAIGVMAVGKQMGGKTTLSEAEWNARKASLMKQAEQYESSRPERSADAGGLEGLEDVFAGEKLGP